jgi:GNAT superfamily N-acetyltransferase
VDIFNVIINQASIKDWPMLQKIVRDCIRTMEGQGIYQWDDIYPDQTTLQSDIDTKALWVARINGDIGGMIVLNEYQSPEYQRVQWQYNGRILVVHRLAVAPSYQRQKLAVRLMQFAEEYADAGGTMPFGWMLLFRTLLLSDSIASLSTLRREPGHFEKESFIVLKRRYPCRKKQAGKASCKRQIF